jgi:AAA domain-containing protein
MRIISATERLREKSGVKMLIVGPPKIGKTSLLRTIDPKRVLFADLESGDLAIADVPVDTLRLQTWQECRDLACFLTGPNPSLPPTACYSEAHYEAIRSSFEGMSLDKYETYFVDSITVASRLCFRWCEQQPESFSERTGKKDVRGCFGLLGREMIGWLTQLQHARGKNVIFVAVLEWITDEFKRGEWSIQIEGQKTGRELPAIVDEIVSLNFVSFDDGQPPTRCFICTPNRWAYPAGDRSGKLEELEPADLGALLRKVSGPGQRKPFQVSSTERALESKRSN